jgi:hypothetical protein
MSIRPNRRARRGLSFVEFVGFVFAITAGIAMGSMYLGVDVEEAAVSALQYVEIMPRPAEEGRPGPKAVSTSPSATGSKTTNELPPSAPAAEPPASPGADAEAVALTPDLRHELTTTYWEALNACMRTEVQHRAVQPEGGLLLHDYLAQRHEGHEHAAEAIRKLKLWGVDGHVAAYAKRVRDWHETGAEMFRHARDLVTDAPTAQLSGPFAQDWHSANTQHQMEERLLAEKHAAVQSYLDHAGRTAETAAK